MNTTIETSRLTAHDRCDQCGAQAYVKVTLTSGGDLLFCGHHARAHEDKLRSISSEYIDETAKLNEGASI